MSSMGQADLRFRKHIPACRFSFEKINWNFESRIADCLSFSEPASQTSLLPLRESLIRAAPPIPFLSTWRAMALIQEKRIFFHLLSLPLSHATWELRAISDSLCALLWGLAFLTRPLMALAYWCGNPGLFVLTERAKPLFSDLHPSGSITNVVIRRRLLPRMQKGSR